MSCSREEVNAVLAEAERLLRRSEALALEARRPLSTKRKTLRSGFAEAPAYRAVSIQLRSSNPKLAPQRKVEARSGRNRYEPIGPFVASTYASIAATCPGSCPFRDNGCFAQAGASHLTMGSLDRAGRRVSALAVSLAEADKLGAMWVRGVPQDGGRDGQSGRDLRLHVGGDVSCESGAQSIALAVRSLQRRRGLGACWTYTHRWREIPRRAFGSISVLASCETPTDVEAAHGRGYASAITVGRFPDGKSAFAVGRFRAIPCPFEAGSGVTCVKCRLCFDDGRLRRRGDVIAFEAHGSQAGRARERLRVLNETG